MRKSIALGIAAIFVSGGVALAVQQGAAAKKLLVKSPPSGNKKIVYLSKNTTATLDLSYNDPISFGASFFIDIAGPAGGSQCMLLPSSGWSPIGTIGRKYKDPTLANGPVKVALIKKTPSGNFLLKIIAKNGTGIAAITFDPGGPTTSYNTNFKINGGGDEWCASNGTAVPTTNDGTKFLVKNDDGTTCVAACSSPSGAFLELAAAF